MSSALSVSGEPSGMDSSALLQDIHRLHREFRLAEALALARQGHDAAPDHTDMYGHPAFLKEVVRLLVAAGEWAQAADLVVAIPDRGIWGRLLMARGGIDRERLDIAFVNASAIVDFDPRHPEANAMLQDISRRAPGFMRQATMQTLARPASISTRRSRGVELPEIPKALSRPESFWHGRVVGYDWKAVLPGAGVLSASGIHGIRRFAVVRTVPGRTVYQATVPGLYIDGPAVMIGGHYNYFHNLVDYLINYYYFKRASLLADLPSPEGFLWLPGVRLLVAAERAAFFNGLLDILDLPLHRVVRIGWAEVAKCSNLLLLPRAAIMDGVVRDPAPFRWLRSLVMMTKLARFRRQRIYVSRMKAPSRRVNNEAVLLARLECLDFHSVVLEDFDVLEQLWIFAHADFVIGPHGAGLSNIIVCAPRTRVIELMAADGHKPNYFSNLAQGLGFMFERLHLPGAWGEDADVDVDLVFTIAQRMLAE